MREVRVLYVEDELTLRGLVVECLNELLAPKLGLKWTLSATSQDARAKLGSPFDLVLLDLELPGGGKFAGLRLLEWLRARDTSTPVIVISAWLDSDAALKVRKLDAEIVPKGGTLAIEPLAELFVELLGSPYDRVAPLLAGTREPLDDKMRETQNAIVRHAVAKCGGNKSEAARVLSVARQSSRLKIDAPTRLRNK